MASAWRSRRPTWRRATIVRGTKSSIILLMRIVSDGDLMEGVAAEAASLAGHLKLGKLIYLYDDNGISLAASTDLTFSEDRAKRFDAYGWHTQTVEDGNDLDAMDRALRARSEPRGRRWCCCARTSVTVRRASRTALRRMARRSAERK